MRSCETVSGLAFCATFFSRLRKGMKRQSLILSGFRRAFGQTLPGFQNMCIEARHLFHPPCRNPEGRRSPGFSLGGMAGVTRHSTKENFHLPPATETGSPAVASSQRAEQERSGRFISQEGVRGRDLCMLSPADAAHGFSFGFHSGGLCIQSDGYHSCARIRTGK